MTRLSFQETLKSIFELWKKTYVSLLPLTFLVVLCFDSSLLFNSIILAVLLCFPGLYLSNIILLKLANVFRQEPLFKDEALYSLAFARLPNTLMLFLGLGGIFLFCFLLTSSLLGFLFGLVICLLLLVIYSYLLFAWPLVVIDNLDPIQAIKKSIALINHHIGYITGIFLVVGIIQAVCYLILFFMVGLTASSAIYNLIFTTLNLALCIVVLESLKKQDA